MVACLQGDPLNRAAVEVATRQDNASRLGTGGPCLGDYNVPGALRRPRLFIPGTDPQGAGPLIRDLSGEVDFVPKGNRVHVHAAYHIAMPHKGASRTVAAPDTTSDFLLPPTYWPPARCSPLRTGEALDVGKRGYIGEIADISAIFPLTQALIVMTSSAPVPHPMGIADEQATNPLLPAKGNHSVCALMAQISDLPALAGAGFLPGGL